MTEAQVRAIVRSEINRLRGEFAASLFRHESEHLAHGELKDQDIPDTLVRDAELWQATGVRS